MKLKFSKHQQYAQKVTSCTQTEHLTCKEDRPFTRELVLILSDYIVDYCQKYVIMPVIDSPRTSH
jgi:hypothetical protein